MANLEGFRAYARLDEDDPVAAICYEAAVGYAETAGVVPPKDAGTNPQWQKLYDLFVYAVGLHFFDNRGFSPGMSVNSVLQDDFVDRWITKIKIMLEAYGGAANGNP